MSNIAFIGLSHLGILYSLATAAQGFNVIGYHPDEALCRRLSQGDFPVSEPGLTELFQKHRSKIRFTSHPAELKNHELTFIALDVKTDAENQSDLHPLHEIIQPVVPHLKAGSTLVLLSQVPPGFTRELVEKIKNTGCKVGFIYYQVETLIFGQAVERALHPERYIVGSEDPSHPIPSVYRNWFEAFNCPILLMRYESAELAKLAINFFLVSSVSTTNTLADLCEKIGADWSEIRETLRLDQRIGPKAYLNPGLGLSGGNLERDLETFNSIANEVGSDWRLIEAWRGNSLYRKKWTLRLLMKHLPSSEKSSVAIWGLAYKENTNSTKNSPSLDLLESIPHLEKRAYDPQVKLELKTHPNLLQFADPLECCRGADALAIMTPWPEFKIDRSIELQQIMRGRLILDPYGLLQETKLRQLGFTYFKLGA